MQDSQHNHCLIRAPKVDRVRERVEQGAADVMGDQRESEWALGDSRERSIDVAEEPRCKAGALRLVPARGIVEVGLGKRPNDEPAGHSVQWLVSNFLRRRS